MYGSTQLFRLIYLCALNVIIVCDSNTFKFRGYMSYNYDTVILNDRGVVALGGHHSNSYKATSECDHYGKLLAYCS